MRFNAAAMVVGLVAVMLVGGPAMAGGADVLDVQLTANEDGSYRFEVTVAHDDEGWDHYADLWQVVAPDGTVLGERELLHPHETEQPFTRSLSSVVVPADTEEVTVRAHDSVHGFGGAEVTVAVPR